MAGTSSLSFLSAYSGDVNRLFRRDVNKSERSDAGVAMMLEDIHIRQQATVVSAILFK